jgi:hypothetical protein
VTELSAGRDGELRGVVENRSEASRSIARTDVPGASRVTFGLDKEKLRRDAGASRTEFDKSLTSLELKLDELSTRSKHFTAEERVAVDRQIAELESTCDAIARKIERHESATGTELFELERDIKTSLQEATAAVDRALESSKSK